MVCAYACVYVGRSVWVCVHVYKCIYVRRFINMTAYRTQNLQHTPHTSAHVHPHHACTQTLHFSPLAAGTVYSARYVVQVSRGYGRRNLRWAPRNIKKFHGRFLGIGGRGMRWRVMTCQLLLLCSTARTCSCRCSDWFGSVPVFVFVSLIIIVFRDENGRWLLLLFGSGSA